MSDVEAIDIPFYNSLKYVLENDPEPLDLTFTVLEETFGEVTEYELKPGGAFIPVVIDNKQEYVELMVQWRLSNGIGPQTENLVKGLREMIPRQYLNSFDAQELEWVIAGTPEINLDDWKNNTIYWGGKLYVACGESLCNSIMFLNQATIKITTSSSGSGRLLRPIPLSRN